MQYGACRGEDVNIFFPPTGSPGIYSQAAKRICATCLYQDQCCEYAVTNFIDDGVWGGTTRLDRRRIRRQRRLDQVLAVRAV